jgi:hypothetical protein
VASVSLGIVGAPVPTYTAGLPLALDAPPEGDVAKASKR